MSMKIRTQVRFAIVPKWVLADPGERPSRLVASPLSDKAVRLYALLACLAEDDTKTTHNWSRPRLAEACGCSAKTIDRTLAELVAFGAIEKILRFDEDNESQNESDYLVKVLPPPENTWSSVSRGGDMGDAPPGTPVAPGGGTPVSPLLPDVFTPEVDTSLRSVSAGDVGDAETPVTTAVSTSRRTDPIWDALVEAGYAKPTNDGERGKWNRACKLLRQSGANADEVLRRSKIYRKTWVEAKGLEYQPLGLASNWTRLASEKSTPTVTAITRPDCNLCEGRSLIAKTLNGTAVPVDHPDAGDETFPCPNCRAATSRAGVA